MRALITASLAWIASTRSRFLVVGVVLCALLPPIFSWPELPPMPAPAQAAWAQYWHDILKLKVDNPSFDYTRDFPPESNQAKRNFRITVPLLAHVTGLGMSAVPVIRFALQGMLLICLVLAAERACGDRLAALGAALAVAGTYVGTSVWMDEWGWFDNCAQAFLLLALVARRPGLVLAAMLAAAFTDERSLIAAPLVCLCHAWSGAGRGTRWAAVWAIPAYAAARIALSLGLGLHNASAGIGTLDMVTRNLRAFPSGAWSALEGGWLMVGGAYVASSRSSRQASGLCLAVATAVPVLAAVAVTDFTRSASYAFPGVLAGLALWSSLPAPGTARGVRLRRWALAAAALSLLSPNLFVMGRTFVQSNVLVRFLGGTPHPHL